MGTAPQAPEGRGAAPTLAFVSSPEAPAPVGHYSQAVRVGDVLYCSGQLPIEPSSGALVGGDVEEQARQALGNLTAVLRAGGSDLRHVFKATVYLVDIAQASKMNAAWERAFADTRPARVVVEVSRLPLGAGIEIDCTALVPSA